MLQLLQTASELNLDDLKEYCSNYLVTKTNLLNTSYVFYESSKVFNLKTLRKEMFHYAERTFEIFVQRQDFLEMNFKFVAELLSRSQLKLSSEMQVFNAAISWLKYNLEKRSKYALYILSKVRLPLLSVSELNIVQRKILRLECNNQLHLSIENTINSKKTSLLSLPRHYYRYYSQNKCDVIVCGGIVKRETTGYPKMVNQTHTMDGDDFTKVKRLGSLIDSRYDHHAVDLGERVYVLGGHHIGTSLLSVRSVEAFSKAANSWEVVTSLPDDRMDFSVCGFMGKIYVVGGNTKNGDKDLRSCTVYDPKKNVWGKIAHMKESRSYPACTVFDGKIVVSGGSRWDKELFFEDKLNTVEYYDYCTNKWAYMPSMKKHRFRHNSVGIRNQLFMLGGHSLAFHSISCEVFNIYTGVFTIIKPAKFSLKREHSCVVPIGNSIFVFNKDKGCAEYYDIEKQRWFRKGKIQLFEKFKSFCCVQSIQL